MMNRNNSRRTKIGKAAFQYDSLEPRQLLATLNVTTSLDVIDAADGLMSLREAVIESNSNSQDDEIVLLAGTYQLTIAGISESGSQTGDLNISPDGAHAVTIRGAGATLTTVDANSIDRVFSLQEDSNVTFADLHITGGNDGQTTSINRPSRRGGIFSDNSQLKLQHVHMTDNGTGNFGVGGAIYIAGGSYEISESEFTGNDSGISGSAIFARQTSGVISKSNISDNTANSWYSRYSGSAIESRDGSLILEETKVDRNFRGVKTLNGTLDVVGSRFLKHGDASPSFSSFSKTEYAISADGTSVSIVDSRFTANEKAIDFTDVTKDLSISGSLFHGNFNSVVFKGNALSVTESIFQRQTDGRGAIQFETVTGQNLATRVLTVESSTFQFNNASAIHGRMQTAIITGSEFLANAGQGGVYHLGDLFIRNSSFENQRNTSGIVHAGEELQILNSQITGSGNSGLNSQQTGNVLISNSQITKNRAKGFGSGLRFSPFFDGDIVISNSLIAENRALQFPSGTDGGDGGAIYVAFSVKDSNITIASSTIVKNRADRNGGVAAATPGLGKANNIEFRNSIFWGNVAPLNPLLPLEEFNAVGFSSVFSDLSAGDGNISFGGAANNNQDRYPQFENWGIGDYQLQASSRAVDAGDNLLLERDAGDVDEDGNTIEFTPALNFFGRTIGGTTDIGAFELRG